MGRANTELASHSCMKREETLQMSVPFGLGATVDITKGFRTNGSRMGAFVILSDQSERST